MRVCVCVCVRVRACMRSCVRVCVWLHKNTYYVHAHKILCNAISTIPHTCFVALAVTVSVESGGEFLFEQLGQNSESVYYLHYPSLQYVTKAHT